MQSWQLEGQLGRSRVRLGALDAEVDEKARALARARAQVQIAQRRLSERVVDIYTSDERTPSPSYSEPSPSMS